jgi:hypothetical protein
MNNITLANYQQSRAVYTHTDTKEKLHKTNAAIWFNENPINVYELVPSTAIT